jgi:hypothetical protein
MEKFSNHWKTAEKFFQSLEKPAGIFQPLEKKFPIIGKSAGGRGARGGGAAGAAFPETCGKPTGNVRRAGAGCPWQRRSGPAESLLQRIAGGAAFASAMRCIAAGGPCTAAGAFD